MPDEHKVSLYRIVQESLTNCARHAEAKSVVVKLASEEGRYVVCIVDDGKGFVPTHEGRGIGLIGIEERVAEIKGLFKLSSLPGTGTKLYVSIPLVQRSEGEQGEVEDALSQQT